MRAILVKNEKFETVGLHVKNEKGDRILSYGICPSTMSWCKDIDYEFYSETINEIIRLLERKQMYHNFIDDFFGVLRENNVKGDRGYNLTRIEEKEKTCDNDIKRLIAKIG